MLHGAIGCQRHLRSGHCCSCTTSCEAHPPQSYSADTGIPIICNSDQGLQQFKGISTAVLTPCSFGPGRRVAINSNPCPCSSLGFSFGHSPLGVYLFWRGLIYVPQSLRGLLAVSWTNPWLQMLQGLPVLVWIFLRGHRHFRVCVLPCGLIHR